MVSGVVIKFKQIYSMQKIAIITGSSKGIGAGTAEVFLDSNEWIVFGCSRSENKQLSSKQNFFHFSCDLTQQDSIYKFLDFVKSHKSFLQITKDSYQISFVHNFGLTENKSAEDTSLESWKKIFLANVDLPFVCVKEFSQFMPSGSSHLFVGSTLSTIAVPNSCAYVSSKHALAGLMRSVAIDLASKNIRSNLICPGFTETDMANFVVDNASALSRVSQADMQKILESKTPLKRFLKPKEIGEFILFLANNPSINGEILHLNGGFGLL
jgi:3-oxoacyl-[acyl-carrier protein] reductase